MPPCCNYLVFKKTYLPNSKPLFKRKVLYRSKGTCKIKKNTSYDEVKRRQFHLLGLRANCLFQNIHLLRNLKNFVDLSISNQHLRQKRYWTSVSFSFDHYFDHRKRK